MPHEWTSYAVVALAAFCAGVMNSVAGGGTLLTFPALTLIGLNPVDANITSTVALLPGSLAGAWGFRDEVRAVRQWLRVLLPPCVVGGVLGALLLTLLPAEVFRLAVPWLVLAASALFAAQPLITKWTGLGHPEATPARATVAGVAAFQFVVAVYGGYFGAGIGILMLSSLAFMGIPTVTQMNALKTLLAAVINAVSIGVFLVSGRIDWPAAGVMAAASVVGGYGGARASRHLPKPLMRAVIIVTGFGLAAYFFAKEYGGW